MYKLIAIDIDGTLLSSEGMVSWDNRQAIRKALDKGILVVLCSGRIAGSVRIYAKLTGADRFMIAGNGSVVRDLRQNFNLYESVMPQDKCLSIIDICHENNVYFHAYIGDKLVTEELKYTSLGYDIENRFYPPEDRIAIEVVDDIKEYISTRREYPNKFVVISDEKQPLRPVGEEIMAMPGIEMVNPFKYDCRLIRDGVTMYDMCTFNLEIMSQNTNKGKALKILAEYLGILPDEIMAVGDNENDIHMIEFAGLGVAMGNAAASLKERADHITQTNNESGVAKAIEKFLL